MHDGNSWANSRDSVGSKHLRNADVSIKDEGSASSSASGPDTPTVIEFPKASRDRGGPFVNSEGSSIDPEATIGEGMPPPLTSPLPPVRHIRPAVQSAHLEAGQVLGGRYEILELLGEGGMGAVYKARDRELDRPVALKTIRPELASKASTLARFKQELLLSRQVTHKNVIRIYDLGDADGVKFITMEFVEGRDLRSIIHEKKKLSPQESVDTMRQVCEGLDAAHSAGVIHRDLKPQNIMQEDSGRILVMDFGLARTQEGAGMTQTGALVGTLEYMSPEQALGKPLDRRSDLFTAGLILYEMLTGEMPFRAESALASLIKRTKERAVPVSDLDQTIPGRLSAVVSKCLETDPTLRYQTAGEMLRDLDAWQGKVAGATLRFHADVRPWGRTVHWPILAGAVTTLVLAIVGYVFRGHLLSPPTRIAESGPVMSLAVMPFQNKSGDASWDWLGSGLAEMLNADVGESAHLRSVPFDRVRQVFHDLRISANSALDPPTLGHLGESTNADILVWGQYARMDGEIRIDATLQDRKHKRTLQLKSEAPSEKELTAAVDNLAALIRQNLGLSSDLQKELQAQSFKPGSSSVDALRDYTEGLQLLRQGNNLQARRRLQAATKEDPEFAAAFSRLSEAYSALGYEKDAEQSGRQAVELSQNLSPVQRSFMNATLARVMKDDKKAIEEYETLAKRMPQNSDVELSLGALYTDTGEYDKARLQLSELLQKDPKNPRVLWQMGGLELMSGNTDAAFDPLNRGLSVAVQKDNQEAKALILHAIGVAYRLTNKPQDALNNYQQSLEINKRLGQKWGMAASLSEMAQAYSLLGRPDKTLDSLNQTLRLEQEIGAKKEAGDTLIDLGVFYDDRGRHDEALQMYKESLQIQRDSGDENYQALCLNNIGNTYFAKGQYQDALTYFQQALSLREKLKVPGAIAGTVESLAETNVRLGQYDQAAGLYLRALDLYRSAGDDRGAAAGSGHLATLFIYEGRFGAAVKSSEDAVKTFRNLKEKSSVMAEMLNEYGDALAEAGRLDEAQKVLDEALGLARELNSRDVVAEVLARQAKVAFYRGNPNSAQALYTQSLNFASRTKDHEQVVMSKIGLAKVNAAKGHAREAGASLKSLGLEADKLGSQYLSAECAVDLGEALVETKDFARARQAIKPTLNTSEKLGMRILQVRAHYVLGALLRLSGNSAEASGQYQQALRLLEESRKEPGAENLLHRADLGSLYEDATRWVQTLKAN